jgi:hypothetical protein
MLKDKSVDTEAFSLLRKMKPMRQIEAVELMSAMNNFTARYAHALLAATRREDLAQPDRPKKIRGLSPEQMARMEREMDGLQREFKAVSASYGDTVLNLVIASGGKRLRGIGRAGFLELRQHTKSVNRGAGPLARPTLPCQKLRPLGLVRSQPGNAMFGSGRTTPQDYPENNGLAPRRERECGHRRRCAGANRRPHPCASISLAMTELSSAASPRPQ